ncbi:MAG: hypothetical protein R3E39_04095 [Anaerolineae bacterium]
MKRSWLAVVIGVLVLVSGFRVLAQTDTVKQYTAQNLDWHVQATIDYQAGAKGANLFLSAAADAEGHIYVANYSNVLIVDGKTGNTVGTIVDKSGTIQQYSDVATTNDGNLWIADNRSKVYQVDANGNILTIVSFHTSPGFSDERNPSTLETDQDGNLYVSYGGFGVFFQIFSPDGEYIRSIITGADKIQGVGHFTFAPDGTLYILGNGVGWISEEGGQAVVHEFAPEFMAEQQFIQYKGLVIDAEGNIYFSAGSDPDLGLSIFKLNKEGTLVGQYGQGQERKNWSNAFGVDELGHTLSLALDADGALIIADTNNSYSQLIKINMQD